MKAKKDEILTTVIFCAFLAVMMLGYLLLPKRDFSELEKRYLKDAPKLTWQTLSSGAFGEELEEYLADRMPGRNFFVGLNAYFDRLTGRQVTKEIYTADGGRLVEAPVKWNAGNVEKNMRAINAFADAIGQPLDLMLVPSAGWAAQNCVTCLADPYTDRQMIASVYDAAGEGIRTVDLCDVFDGRADLYFKTDHHWNSRGAFTGYKAYMQHLGRDHRPEDAFTVGQYGPFRGSTYSRSALWLTPAEELELWLGSDGLTVTNGESGEVHNGVFYWERLEEADKYTVNLDGNHSIVRIDNPNGEGKLLVIRDSYSNSLGTFLAESYETVVLVDLRYYKGAVSELCAAEGFDNVLVCYSIGNFMTDANVIWLR